MEKYLSKIQQKHYGILAFVLTCIATYVMLSYEQVLSTGKYIFLEGDALNQYVPFVKQFIRDLLTGESLGYSWSLSMGMNTSLCYAYYVLNPFNLLYIIPVDEVIISAAIYILKTGLMAFFFQRFASKVLDCNGIESIVFSIFYAMCSFNVIYNVLNLMWMDAMYMLPLICQLIYELQKTGKWKMLVAAYTYLFTVQFYMAYIVGIFSCLFAVILWICYIPKNRKISILLKYVTSVLLAIGLSGAVWLPVLRFLQLNNLQIVEEFSTLKANAADILYNLSWGQMQGLEGVYPYIYCGIPTILLFVLYFSNKKIKLREKICTIVLSILLLMCMTLLPLYQVMHAFDMPNQLGYRFAFLFSFLLCITACRQSRYLKEVTVKKGCGVLAGTLILYAVLFYVQTKIELEEEPIIWVVAIGNFLLLCLWGIVFLFLHKNENKGMQNVIIILALVLVEMITNGIACYSVLGAENLQRHYDIYKSSIESGNNKIEDDSFYRIIYYNDYAYNSDSWFGYNGIADFNSAINVMHKSAMENLGFATSELVIYDAGITPVTKMLFGVKYEIIGVSPYLLALNMPEPTVQENTTALSLGYMVDDELLSYDMESKHVFDNMDGLLTVMSGTEIECYENIAFDNVTVIEENAYLSPVPEGTAVMHNTQNEEDGYIIFNIPYVENKKAYVQFQREESLYVLDSPILSGGFENSVYVRGALSMSYAKEMSLAENGFEVMIQVRSNDRPVAYQQANFCYYNDEELLKAYDILAQNQMVIKEYGNGYVDANVNVPEERTVLFTSIPYDEGWTVYVDGVETETKAVVGDAFLALELEPGYHELEFEYEAPGGKLGMGISTVSICVYVLLIIVEVIMNRKTKVKEGIEKTDVEDRTK